MSSIEFQMPKNRNSIIKVIGVGGGGGNAVNNMFRKGIKGVDFIVCNTDVQALDMSPVPNKIRLGANQTEGLGAGANPELGRLSAIESLEQIREVLKTNTKMVFVTAGMGGGTGTGAAPVIAGLAKEMGILTVAIVTTPFRFEGKKRMGQAYAGIKALEAAVDTIVTINNDNLTEVFGKNVTMKQAFEEADTVLCDAAKGIAEIITNEGYINVDFADVNTIMKDGGTALMGTATYSGEDRAIRAAEDAISSPMLDNVNIHGSRGILVNITAAAESLRLDETTTIVEYIQEAAGDNADIIFGTVYDDNMGDLLSVTVIATGFDNEKRSFTGANQGQPNKQVLDINAPVQPKPQPKPEERKPVNNLEDFSITSSPAFTFELENTKPPVTPVTPVQANLFEERLPPVHREEPPRSLKETELEERMRKLRSTDYNYHNPESLKGMEDMPAYLRKSVNLQEEQRGEPKLSKLSLEDVDETRFTLSDNNTYLHDNVD
ncbi:MAG: cell division protein FtsZ [Bacteroidetes bacterium]|nr:cell division protein FtsZ [Bacteroidota bacterium]